MDLLMIFQRILGERFNDFTSSELDGLEHIFIEAGEMAVLANIGTPKETALAIDFAKNLLKVARTQQVINTSTGFPDKILTINWQIAENIGNDNSHWLLNIPGVIGIGPAYKIKDSKLTEEVSLTIYVNEKLSSQQLHNRLHIPQRLYRRDGVSVKTDIIQLGSFDDNGSVKIGDSVSSPVARKIGTIGAFAIDLDTSKPVALTAMHVTGLKRNYPDGYNNASTIQFSAPSHNYPDFEFLGYLVKGRSRHSNSGVDASSISIEDNRKQEFYHPRLGNVIGWRPINSSDQNLPVQMYGDYSRYQTGRIMMPISSLPQIGLDSVILVDIKTSPGDSGAALIDQDGCILGILSGRIKVHDKYFNDLGIRDLAVFCTIGYVLQSLNCDIINK
jgi:hypothetical protein